MADKGADFDIEKPEEDQNDIMGVDSPDPLTEPSDEEPGDGFCTFLRFVLYLVLACVPPLASVCLFSAAGYGVEVHHWLLAHTVYSFYFFMTAVVILLVFVMFDASSWTGWAKHLKHGMKSILIVSLSVSAIFLVRFHPWAPMAVFLTMMPAWFIIIFWIETHVTSGSEGLNAASIFMNRLKIPMAIASVATIALWVAFLASDQDIFNGFIRPKNDTEVSAAFEKFTSDKANDTMCPQRKEYSQNTSKFDILEQSILQQEQDHCFPELLLWFAPMIIGATMLELTLMLSLLAQKVPFSLAETLGSESELRHLSPLAAAKIAMCEGCMRLAAAIIAATIMVTYTVSTLAGFNVEASAAANGIIFFMLNSLLVLAGFMLVAMNDISLEQLPIWVSASSP
jgi:hypothetical protein